MWKAVVSTKVDICAVFFCFFLGDVCCSFCLHSSSQISLLQTSADKIIRHSEHNSTLCWASGGSSLVSLHLVVRGCDTWIITLSKASRPGKDGSAHLAHLVSAPNGPHLCPLLQNGEALSHKVTHKHYPRLFI